MKGSPPHGPLALTFEDQTKNLFWGIFFLFLFFNNNKKKTYWGSCGCSLHRNSKMVFQHMSSGPHLQNTYIHTTTTKSVENLIIVACARTPWENFQYSWLRAINFKNPLRRHSHCLASHLAWWGLRERLRQNHNVIK